MKRVLIIMMLALSLFGFSLDKSGIKEYDSIDLSQGRILAYFNDKRKIVEEPMAMFYRKDYGKKGNLTLIVDFYADTDTPEKIFKLKDLDNEDSINGKMILYNKNGTISYIADMKDGKIDGQKISYEKGEVVAVVNFKDNLANGSGTRYYEGKKFLESTYKYGFLDGEFTVFYPDGTKTLTQVFKDNRVVSSKNINYKLQKTGEPEFDNIDFSKGEIIYYYSENGTLVDGSSIDAAYYRKIFNEENGTYTIVDFYKDSGNVQGIGKGTNKKDFYSYTTVGSVYTFYENGILKSKTTYKNFKPEGEAYLYDQNGKLKAIELYEDYEIKNLKILK